MQDFAEEAGTRCRGVARPSRSSVCMFPMKLQPPKANSAGKGIYAGVGRDGSFVFCGLRWGSSDIPANLYKTGFFRAANGCYD